MFQFQSQPASPPAGEMCLHRLWMGMDDEVSTEHRATGSLELALGQDCPRGAGTTSGGVPRKKEVCRAPAVAVSYQLWKDWPHLVRRALPVVAQTRFITIPRFMRLRWPGIQSVNTSSQEWAFEQKMLCDLVCVYLYDNLRISYNYS